MKAKKWKLSACRLARQLVAFWAEEIFSKSSKRVICRARTYQYSPARVWNPLNSKYFDLEFSKQNNFYPDSCKTDLCSDLRQISSPKTSPLERIATTSSSWIISSEPEMIKFSSSTDSPLKAVYWVQYLKLMFKFFVRQIGRQSCIYPENG